MLNQNRLGATIGIGNQKGGVGKSTNTVHIAAALGEKGYRCLIIDLDPSAGSTKHLGIPPDGFMGTLELLTTDEKPEALALGVDKGLPKNVFLIPARTELNELDKVLSKFVDRTTVLDRALYLARPSFDFILLDTPPNAGWLTTVAAYSSAEWFLLSAFPHPLSVAGLNEALKDIADVRSRRNTDLEILGIVITAVDARSNLWKEVDELISRELPGRGFETRISQAIELAKISGQGKTIFQTRLGGDHKVAHQYRALATEIEWRVTHRSEFVEGKLPPADLSKQGSTTSEGVKGLLMPTTSVAQRP